MQDVFSGKNEIPQDNNVPMRNTEVVANKYEDIEMNREDDVAQ